MACARCHRFFCDFAFGCFILFQHLVLKVELPTGPNLVTNLGASCVLHLRLVRRGLLIALFVPAAALLA